MLVYSKEKVPTSAVTSEALSSFPFSTFLFAHFTLAVAIQWKCIEHIHSAKLISFLHSILKLSKFASSPPFPSSSFTACHSTIVAVSDKHTFSLAHTHTSSISIHSQSPFLRLLSIFARLGIIAFFFTSLLYLQEETCRTDTLQARSRRASSP